MSAFFSPWWLINDLLENSLPKIGTAETRTMKNLLFQWLKNDDDDDDDDNWSAFCVVIPTIRNSSHYFCRQCYCYHPRLIFLLGKVQKT